MEFGLGVSYLPGDKVWGLSFEMLMADDYLVDLPEGWALGMSLLWYNRPSGYDLLMTMDGLYIAVHEGDGDFCFPLKVMLGMGFLDYDLGFFPAVSADIKYFAHNYASSGGSTGNKWLATTVSLGGTYYFSDMDLPLSLDLALSHAAADFYTESTIHWVYY